MKSTHPAPQRPADVTTNSVHENNKNTLFTHKSNDSNRPFPQKVSYFDSLSYIYIHMNVSRETNIIMKMNLILFSTRRDKQISL